MRSGERGGRMVRRGRREKGSGENYREE